MSLLSIFGVTESNLTVPSASSFSTRPASKLSTRGIGKGVGEGGGGGGKLPSPTSQPTVGGFITDLIFLTTSSPLAK